MKEPLNQSITECVKGGAKRGTEGVQGGFGTRKGNGKRKRRRTRERRRTSM